MKRIYLFTIGVMLLVTSCGHKKEGDATLIRPVKTASAAPNRSSGKTSPVL